jgi:hypothetical protein
MLIVGRGGKIMSFVGSIVVVIDIIGPESIREWAARTRRTRPGELARKKKWISLARHLSNLVAAILVLAILKPTLTAWLGTHWYVTLPVILVVMIVAIFLTPFISSGLEVAVRGIARALESQRWEPVIRWLGFSFAFVGFAFDLLAS